MIYFYKKILKIEETLNVKFKPKSSINKEDLQKVEELYRMLIEKKPCKEYIDIDKLNLSMSRKIEDETYLLNSGAFQVYCKHVIDIFGVNIELPSIIVIYYIQ